MKLLAKIILWEWKRIFSLPVHYCVLIVFPPILFFFFAFVYNKQHAEELPVALWDEDHSSISRTMAFLLNQTASIKMEGTVNSLDELQDKIQKGELLGAVHFPEGMEKNIKSSHPVNVTLYTNSASLVPAKLIYKEAAEVIMTAGSGVILQKYIKQGMNANKAMALVQPIKLTSYMMYNPDYNYQEYLVPGLITVTMQMVLVMIGVLLLNYEKQTNTELQLFSLANNSASVIIAGKTIAHLAISWLSFILITGVVFPLFSLERPGTTLNFFILYNLLVLACLGVGLLISSIFSDPMLSSDIALFYTSPSFVFSGFTFPRWAMPLYDQYYAVIMPYTHFLDAFFKVYFMQLSLQDALPEIKGLLWFALITYPAALIIYQRKINKAIHAAR